MSTEQKIKGSTREYSYQPLKDRIFHLELEPGTKISEKEIADELNVSRTPVREAFMKLAEEELLDIIPQSGTIVSRINLRHVEEGRFIREKIEKEIVALACEIFPEEFRFRLKPILRFRTYARETIISISCLSWTRSSIKFCLRVRARTDLEDLCGN